MTAVIAAVVSKIKIIAVPLGEIQYIIKFAN